MIRYFWAHENNEDNFLDSVANMVLYSARATHFNYVSIFNDIYFEGKMVSLLFYDGAHLGENYSFRDGFLRSGATSGKVAQRQKLYVGV